ncbi:MAG: hypothetical protein C0505_06125 [Leptothrix sp. (in: Bacteria)]|nr:hypothetical protein [Leptothrix sp. (in: b-proteobacteria)]
MQALALAGHYGRTVEIDLCAGCHLVWFDLIEAAGLGGQGLLALVGAMAAAQSLAHTPLRPALRCARCHGALRTVHNPSRWGRSLQLECVQRHGAWQSFAQFLSQKGLVRAMSSADRARALQRDGALHCVNCGGAVGAGDAACPWCTSVPSVVDVARLARALDPEGALGEQAVHRRRSEAGALNCAACGAAQATDAAWLCPACGATLTAPGLAEAHRSVSALAPALAAHARKPAPHVVKARLALQQPALDRQRSRAADMQREADAQRGGHAPTGREVDAARASWLLDLAGSIVRTTIDTLRRIFGR